MASQRDKSLFHPSLRSGKQCAICGKRESKKALLSFQPSLSYGKLGE